MIRHIWHLTFLAFFGLTIICVVAAILLPHLTAVDSAAEPKQITIAPGASAESIARQLAREHIIRSPLLFQLTAYGYGACRYLQAGTYELSGEMSLREIIHQLQSGKVVLRNLVVPEGLTVAQIGRLFEDEELGTAESFNGAARDPRWQELYSVDENTLEGYLFPNTYQFAHGTPATKVIEMMLDEFDRQWTCELDEEAQSLGFSTHEIITLASVIEKEAKIDRERPLISAVFHNRLQRGWKLDADPTVLYALGNPQRLLTTRDLEVDSPYNTYFHRGLPPGPISNPGVPSILAALRPVQSSYLYFVAIGAGKHHFSTTLAEHKKVIRRMKRNVN